MAVIQGHFDPWHPRILDKTEVQLDAILEAYAHDFPKKLTFDRKGTRKESERVQVISAQWTDRLIGEAREEIKRKFSFKIPDQYHRARNTVRQQPSTGPKVVRKMPYKPASKR